jgi:hypothetical protein
MNNPNNLNGFQWKYSWIQASDLWIFCR